MIEQGLKSIDYEYKILGRVLSNYKPEDEDDDDEEEEEEGLEEGQSDITAEKKLEKGTYIVLCKKKIKL